MFKVSRTQELSFSCQKEGRTSLPAQLPTHLLLRALLPPCCRQCQQLPVLHLQLGCLLPLLQHSSSTLQLQGLSHKAQDPLSGCTCLLLLLHCKSPGLQCSAQQLLLVEAQGLCECLPFGRTPSSLAPPAVHDVAAHHLLPVLVRPAVHHRTHTGCAGQ